MRWESLAKHIELLLEGVYFVWGVLFIPARRGGAPEGHPAARVSQRPKSELGIRAQERPLSPVFDRVIG
jgi:hypothetical protein